MVGTRKRGLSPAKDAAEIGRAQRAAKRKKLLDIEERERRERARLEEDERAKDLELQRQKEEKRKARERNAQRNRLKAKGKFVLEVEFSPEASAAVRLNDTKPPPSEKKGRMGLTPVWLGMLDKIKQFKAKHGHCR